MVRIAGINNCPGSPCYEYGSRRDLCRSRILGRGAVIHEDDASRAVQSSNVVILHIHVLKIPR